METLQPPGRESQGVTCLHCTKLSVSQYSRFISAWSDPSLTWFPPTHLPLSLKVLNMAEIQTRLAYVCCVRQLESVKDSDYCEYIRPPIDRYGTLDFGKFDEIAVSVPLFLLIVPKALHLLPLISANPTMAEPLSLSPYPSQEVGYQHGKTLFDVWLRSGVVDKMLKDRHQEEFHKTKSGNVSFNLS